MELKIDKKNFTDYFLTTLGKAVDLVSIKISPQEIYAICNKPDTSIILFAKYKAPTGVDKDITLNLGDIRKLTRVLDCVKDDIVSFKIESNHLLYKTPDLQFKYHFLDDSIMPKVSLKKEKIESLESDTYFDVDYKRLEDILKGSRFTTETNKIYIYSENEKVYCDLCDKEKTNTDSITLVFSDKLEGVQLLQPIPFNLDIFRMFSGIEFERARIGINNKFKIMSVYIAPTDCIEFRFIISGLVK